MGPAGLRRPGRAHGQEDFEVADVSRDEAGGGEGPGCVRRRAVVAETGYAPSKTFGELLERWFEARSGDWSPSTVQQTRWTIDGS